MTDETRATSEGEQGKTCPECGVSLEGRDGLAHAKGHWRGVSDAAPQEGTEAYERYVKVAGQRP